MKNEKFIPMQIYPHITVLQIKESVVFFGAVYILGNGEYILCLTG